MKPMRRLLAIMLLSTLNLWLIAPALFAGRTPQLPACCRAHGAHHCALHHALPGGAPVPGPAIDNAQTKCPYFPAPNGCTALSQAGVPAIRQILNRATCNTSATPAQSEAHPRLLLSRSIHQRGPPFIA